MELTPSQQQFIKDATVWYYSANKYILVLEAPAGYGKSHVIKYLLENLGKRCNPLILAETNEACSILRRNLGEDYDIKTVCSALNLVMDKSEHILTLKQHTIPDLSNYDINIIDESSMLSEERARLLESYGIKILYVGHRSQLPEVKVTVTEDETFESFVFNQGYTTYRLTEPVRNTGDLFNFLQELEKSIYRLKYPPNNYRINESEFQQYLESESGKQDFLIGKAILLAFTEKGKYNQAVSRRNRQIRHYLFDSLENNRFNVKERLIFRKPYFVFETKVKDGINTMFDLAKYRSKKYLLEVNTKAVIYGITSKKLLGIDCYELCIRTSSEQIKNKFVFLYVPVEQKDLDAILNRHYHKAQYEQNQALRKLKWADYHNISQALAVPSYGYATTIHCAQGATYNTVFVDEKDVYTVRAWKMRMKLLYVACSRASVNLNRIWEN